MFESIDQPNDITIIQDRDTALKDDSTDEVLHMVLGQDEDIDIGRMSESMDPGTDYDFLPRNVEEMDEEQAAFAYGDDSKHEWQGDASPDLVPGEAALTAPTTVSGDLDVFEEPEVEVFPIYKSALRQFQATAKIRPVRVDGPNAFHAFVADKVAGEIDRHVERMQRGHDVLGAASAIAELHGAEDHHAAISAMQEVPLDLPSFAKGKVKCWKDGDHVICSMHFVDAAGQPRVATTAAKPLVDDEVVSAHAEAAGMDPIVVLGALPDLADQACGRLLVKNLARAALSAHEHPDVLGMDDDGTVVLPSDGGQTDKAPLAALMYVEQRADAGDPQAQQEMALIRAAAETPSGQKVAKPMLAASTAALQKARADKQKALNPSLWDRIKNWFASVKEGL